MIEANTLSAPPQVRIARSPQASTWQFHWLCALILSFAYEKPLVYLTSFDRTNPRLFDVLVAIGLLSILPRLQSRPNLPQPFKIWAILVAWFCLCAVIWATGLLPWEYGALSLFRAAKYVEGLLAVYMVSCIPLDARRKRILQSMIVVGGVFIALYCIPEYLHGGSTVVVRQDLEVQMGAGSFAGPFGASYFQLAQTSSLFLIVALGFFLSAQTRLLRFLGPIIAAFIAWPLLFCGSRTGLGLLLLSVSSLFVLEKRLRRTMLALAILLLAVAFLYNPDTIFETVQGGTTIQRLQGSEGGANSLEDRMGLILTFSASSYRAGYLLPIIGAGFNVAPRSTGGGNYYYRVDYGVHSIYLFAIEQAGVLGLILFLWFIVATVKALRKSIAQREPADFYFAKALLAYFLATLIVGIGGHNFWQGFDSGNFNTCLIIVLMVAIIPATNAAPNYLSEQTTFIAFARRR
jgi:O-antigen ligase